MTDDFILNNFQDFKAAIENAIGNLKKQNILERILAKDHTVWADGPEEIANRLGWLDGPREMESYIAEISQFVEDIHRDKITDILLMGMGGSSLAPEFFGRVKVTDKPRFRFHVIDSTHPAVVKKYSDKLEPSRTLYIASSKSGGTVETISLLKFFYNLVRERSGIENTGGHFVAITDPGSKLETIALEYNFRKVFLNNPEIGGRFSALSHFGLVPAALSDWDISRILDNSRNMAEKCGRPDNNPGLFLGALIGILAGQGINKLTIMLPESYRLFGAWIEQLIAESTGKSGKGILPIICNVVEDFSGFSGDRYLVYLKTAGDNSCDRAYENSKKSGIPSIRIDLEDIYDLGGQFYLWEFTTSIASHIMRIHPFNQPNVEAAKSAAKGMIDAYKSDGKLPEPESQKLDENIELYEPYDGDTLPRVFEAFFDGINHKTGSYVAIQAYLNPMEPVMQLLDKFRSAIEKKFNLPVTIGIGPRYLHSTGQLHKGDSGKGLFIQFLENYEPELVIPEELESPEGSISFGTLIKAQCIGDRNALLKAKRNLLSIHFNADTINGLEKLTAAL